MLLKIRNFIRKWIYRKPPISDTFLNLSDCDTTQDLFNRIADNHAEVLLICIEHPRNNKDTSTGIKCYAKLEQDKSILISVVPDVISELTGE